MTKHEVAVDIRKCDLERINRLLDIMSLSEMSDEQLLVAGANTDQCESVYAVRFDDGATMYFDLCSGSENYYDNVVWISPDKRGGTTLECTFELDDIEFDAPNGEIYAVKLMITGGV